ncbi:MAG: RNA ligase family protein [Candidatus Micrarchaeota archaeon]
MHSLDTYPKIARFPIGHTIFGKNYLVPAQVQKLLSGRVIVEEKMDGKGVLFQVGKFQIFAEDLKVRHSIHYRVPAHYAIFDFYDTEREVFLGISGKMEVYRDLKNYRSFFKEQIKGPAGANFPAENFFLVQIMERGKFDLDDLPKLISHSAYGAKEGTYMEGIVVKQMRDSFDFEEDRSGKLVRQEFIEGIETHYSRKKALFNQINPTVEEVNPFLKDLHSIPRELRFKPVRLGRRSE